MFPIPAFLNSYLFRSVNTVGLSFNGGKDCTALFYLVLLYLRTLEQRHSLKIFYLETPDTFPEIAQFVNTLCSRYHHPINSLMPFMRRTFAIHAVIHY
jgi:predicted phosphoadenosine phosphosulfate sulfurtransferase